MKNKKHLLLFFFLLFACLPFSSHALGLESRLSGRIIIEVEKNGEAWYINPVDEKLYYLGRPVDAFAVMRNLGLGINMYDMKRFGDNFPERLKGRILINVEAFGRAAYINPMDSKPYSLGTPREAFSVMRELALGISNDDFNKIDDAKKVYLNTGEVTKENQDNDALLKEIDRLIRVDSVPDCTLSNHIECLREERADLEKAKEKISLMDISTSYKKEVRDELLADIVKRKEYLQNIEIAFSTYAEPVLTPVDSSDWKVVSDFSNSFQMKVPNDWRCSFNVNNVLVCSNKEGNQFDASVNLSSYATDYEEWLGIKDTDSHKRGSDLRFGDYFTFERTSFRSVPEYYLRTDKRYYFYKDGRALDVWLVYNPLNDADASVLDAVVWSVE